MILRHARTTFFNVIKAIPHLPSDVESVPKKNDSVQAVDCVEIVTILHVDCNNTK